MVSLNGHSDTREQAIAEGLLIDVTHSIGPELRCSIAVSAALWHRVDDPEEIAFVVQGGFSEFISRGGDVGEYSFTSVVDRGTHVDAIEVRVLIEPNVTGGTTATYLEESEEYDLRGPRAGSFYTM
jgi:hypothetical protein